jgi:hypothetical protein
VPCISSEIWLISLLPELVNIYPKLFVYHLMAYLLVEEDIISAAQMGFFPVF